MYKIIENEKLVVFDSGIYNLEDNKLFIPEISKKISHTILPVCYLAKKLEEKGIKIITPDVYLKMENKPRAFLISHLNTIYSKELLKNKNITPLILLCQESPFIATKFYLSLPFFSRHFKYSIVFSGMQKLLSRKTNYLKMFFPQPYNEHDFSPLLFGDKKLLTMISGAKSIGSWKKNLILKLIYWLKVKEIYSERLKAIEYFSAKESFDFYGRGWGKISFNSKKEKSIKNSYKGEIDDKQIILQKYKFAFCFENSIFPGYVTEKIFDAMFAGSVPIYLGAPDIKKYIPSSCFIDLRDFKNYDDLYNYISAIKEDKYNEYLISIKKFIASDDYYKFSQESFAETILTIIENEYKLL